MPTLDVNNCKVSVERTAIFDPTGHYRYSLQRCWQATGPKVAFIMLNPSQADTERDDPTLRACMQFAQNWGYPRLEVVNLFAYRTPHPQQLKSIENPIGPENDDYLLKATQTSGQIILAWGNWGGLLRRDQATLKLLTPHRQKLFYLSLNRSGQPRHPLYLNRSLNPIPWISHN